VLLAVAFTPNDRGQPGLATVPSLGCEQRVRTMQSSIETDVHAILWAGDGGGSSRSDSPPGQGGKTEVKFTVPPNKIVKFIVGCKGKTGLGLGGGGGGGASAIEVDGTLIAVAAGGGGAGGIKAPGGFGGGGVGGDGASARIGKNYPMLGRDKHSTSYLPPGSNYQRGNGNYGGSGADTYKGNKGPYTAKGSPGGNGEPAGGAPGTLLPGAHNGGNAGGFTKHMLGGYGYGRGGYSTTASTNGDGGGGGGGGGYYGGGGGAAGLTGSSGAGGSGYCNGNSKLVNWIDVDTTLITCTDCWYKYGGATVETTLCSVGERAQGGAYFKSCPDCFTEVVSSDKRYSAADGKIQIVTAVPSNTVWGTEKGPSHSALTERPGEL
jgi:hypothetical protein